MDYLQAFESCLSFNRTDGSINRTDLLTICQRFGLRFDTRRDPNPHDSTVKFETFKQCINKGYHDDYLQPTSPIPRTLPSGTKLPRQSLHPSSSHHTSRNPLKYVGSPKGHGGGGYDREYSEEHRRSSYNRQDHNRTPDYMLSPDDPRISRPRQQRPPDIDHMTSDPRLHRDHADSSPHPPASYLRTQRSSARSHRGDESEDSGGETSVFYRNLSSKRSKKHHLSPTDLQDKVARLEKENEGLRKELRAAQNTDLQFSNLLRDNERLRQDLKKLNRGPEHDIDNRILERQVEDLKRTRDDLEMEVRKKKEVIFDLKSYKKEYNSLRQKYENQQRDNWRLMEEVQKLRVKVMELENGALIGNRRPGDNSGTEDKTGYSSELSFKRSAVLRNTYHGSGKADMSRECRSRKSNRMEMKRTSSAAQVLDNYDEPQKEEHAYPSRAKSHRSGTYSDASSVAEGLSLVTTTPDEQSQVFMVMGEDVSKNVLPDNMINETELALIYALQNCHSVQEIIKCLVSYGIGTPGEKVQGLMVKNDYLASQIDHLRAKNTMLANSFENAKANMENMYSHSQKVEANNTRLLHAVRYCYQACEIYEVLMELRISSDRRSNAHYFPSFDYSSLESSTRSPDRTEHHSSTSSSSGKPTAILRARSLLHSLDSDTELQNFIPGTRSRPNGTDFRQTVAVWGGSSSQNTGTTSGLSSMSGGIEGDITPEEVERLRLYIQALILRKNHFTNTLVSVEGQKGLDVVKDWELVKDCLPAGHGGQIMDLEDAANAEELCKIREEKAELRSQIYMMDTEKRRMELEVARMLLHKQKNDKVIAELQFQLDKRRRKRDKKNARRGEAAPLTHETPNAQLLNSQERERELIKRYEDLFCFLMHHTRDSHTVSEDLMGFVKEMWRQNSTLVDAFEKTKKRQSMEKKRLKQELVSLMNQLHQGSSAPTNEEPSSGTAYP